MYCMPVSSWRCFCFGWEAGLPKLISFHSVAVLLSPSLSTVMLTGTPSVRPVRLPPAESTEKPPVFFIPMTLV